jgi:hypothetical protein
MSKLYRQGDILFKKIDKIPKKAKKIETDVIVEGEATGHAHKIVNGFIFQTWNEMFIDQPQIFYNFYIFSSFKNLFNTHLKDDEKHF